MKFSPHLTLTAIRDAYHVCLTPDNESIRVTHVLTPQKSYRDLRTETTHYPSTLKNIALVRRVLGRVAVCEQDVTRRGN